MIPALAEACLFGFLNTLLIRYQRGFVRGGRCLATKCPSLQLFQIYKMLKARAEHAAWAAAKARNPTA